MRSLICAEAWSGHHVLLLIMLQLSKLLLQSKVDSIFLPLGLENRPSILATEVEQNITPMSEKKGKVRRLQFGDQAWKDEAKVRKTEREGEGEKETEREREIHTSWEN